jgi:hypothetical protein
MDLSLLCFVFHFFDSFKTVFGTSPDTLQSPDLLDVVCSWLLLLAVCSVVSIPVLVLRPLK